MEQAIEGADAVHRVKRGRPAKKVVKAPIPEPVAEPIPEPVAYKSPKPQVISQTDLPGCDPKAAAYAVRVWNGQSVDVPIAERIRRVMNALRGQNLLTTGLTFPPLEVIS